MTTGTIVANYHPNAPRKLISAIQKAGSERKFAKEQGVNILYVSQLLRDGIEPTDRTEKGRAARVKLFLPRKKPKPRQSQPKPDPVSSEWWDALRNCAVRAMAKRTRQAVLMKKRKDKK
jgi:hypothetical protein